MGRHVVSVVLRYTSNTRGGDRKVARDRAARLNWKEKLTHVMQRRGKTCLHRTWDPKGRVMGLTKTGERSESVEVWFGWSQGRVWVKWEN